MKKTRRRLATLVLFALCSVAAMAQNKIIGKIIDTEGEPVTGATVKMKGGTTGTVSDLNGQFSIEAARGTELEVSYIGYKPQTVKVGNGNLTVTLTEDAKALEEVVVVGFGTQKKVNLTGAVEVIDSK